MSKLIENMIQARELSPAARDADPFDTLVEWAEANALETVSAYVEGEWDDYAWEATNDGTTRRIVLKAPIPFNDVVLYFSTTDEELQAFLDMFGKSSDAFKRDNGLDMGVTRLCAAE